MNTVIITGAAGNLGQAIVKKFLQEGYRVVGTVTSKGKNADELEHDNLELVAVDLSNESDASKFVADVISKYKTIEAAILTVGGFASGTIADTTTDDILKQYKLNFQTTYNVARPVFLQMLKQKSGRIFMSGSRTGIDMKNSKGTVAYGLSKSLIFRLAELMNEEGKAQNVVTTVVAPSIIDTPQNRQAMPGADTSKWVKAEDIAAIIYFYCTGEARPLREPVIKVYNNA